MGGHRQPTTGGIIIDRKAIAFLIRFSRRQQTQRGSTVITVKRFATEYCMVRYDRGSTTLFMS